MLCDVVGIVDHLLHLSHKDNKSFFIYWFRYTLHTSSFQVWMPLDTQAAFQNGPQLGPTGAQLCPAGANWGPYGMLLGYVTESIIYHLNASCNWKYKIYHIDYIEHMRSVCMTLCCQWDPIAVGRSTGSIILHYTGLQFTFKGFITLCIVSLTFFIFPPVFQFFLAFLLAFLIPTCIEKNERKYFYITLDTLGKNASQLRFSQVFAHKRKPSA